MLLFFTAVSVFLLVKFRQIQEEKGAFNLEWWIWLSLLGISLGSVLSVKWLGLFTVATVGVYTIYDLWRLLLNPATTLHKALPAHFLARVLCLIIFPIATYVFWFWVHFKVLNKEDYQIRDLPTIFHGRFDKQHAGQRFDGMPYDVAYESSQVTIRAARWNGPHLFSNADHKYPEGSKQQVVSSSNFQRSQWTFELMWPRYHAKKAASPEEKSKLEFVRNGDYVRVNHVDTGRNMHSHQIKANLTQRDYEVTGFYQRDFGDSNDHFIIEIIDDLRNPLTYIFPWLLPDDHIHPLYTRFRLRHNETGCYLNSGYKHLPAWGGNNIEITCARFLGKHAESVAWYVDRHVNPRLPATPPGFYKPTLLADVWAAQKGMWASNEALTDDPNKDPEPFQSQPWQWPILYRGLRIVNWADDKIKYFMFGNPIVWWGGFASLFGIVIFYVLGFVAQSRGWASVPDAGMSPLRHLIVEPAVLARLTDDFVFSRTRTLLVRRCPRLPPRLGAALFPFLPHAPRPLPTPLPPCPLLCHLCVRTVV